MEHRFACLIGIKVLLLLMFSYDICQARRDMRLGNRGTFKTGMKCATGMYFLNFA